MFNIYGLPNINFIIRRNYFVNNKLFLNEREIYWISFYDSFNNGLNCNQGGNGNIGYIPSDETREKMRQKKLE